MDKDTFSGIDIQKVESGARSGPKSSRFCFLYTLLGAISVLCVFSLLYVVVLAIDVQTLKRRLDSAVEEAIVVDLGNDNNSSSVAQKPVATITRNRRAVTETGAARQRRDSSPINAKGNKHQSHPFTHLAGIADPGSCGNDWLSWHTPQDPGYQYISTDLMTVISRTFIRIHVPGYYHVHSQVTFHGSNPQTMGLEVVKRPQCGSGLETTLLGAKTTPVVKKPVYNTRPLSTDTVSTEGVFHFDRYDEIGVRLVGDRDAEFPTYIDEERPGAYNNFEAFLLIPTDDYVTLPMYCPENSHLCFGYDG